MKHLPKWIKKILDDENLTCGYCKKILSLKELFSVGIQKSNKRSHQEVLSIGILCTKCKEITLFELNKMSLLDLSFEVFEEQSHIEEDNKKELDKKELDKEIKSFSKNNKKNCSKSKITMKEIKKSVSLLNEFKTHDEFLVALGMSLEEIEKYKIKKNRKK